MDFIPTHLSPFEGICALVSFLALQFITIKYYRGNQITHPILDKALINIRTLKFEFGIAIIVSFMVANGCFINEGLIEIINAKVSGIGWSKQTIVQVIFLWGLPFISTFFLFFYTNRFFDYCIRKIG